MNMKDYQAGRERGLQMALEIVLKEGVPGLQRHVSMMTRTGINPPVPRKELEILVRPIRNLVQEAYTVLIIETLHTELDFGPKRVNRFMERFFLKQECIVDDVVSWQDYIDAMRDEMGIEIDCPTMEAEGLIKAKEKRERKRLKHLKE